MPQSSSQRGLGTPMMRRLARMVAALNTIMLSFSCQAPRPDVPRSRVNVASDLVPLQPSSDRFSIYDNALMVLLTLRTQQQSAARRILLALATLQTDDGAIPFSGSLQEPAAGPPYVRSGALAWVGYAAASYLLAVGDGPGSSQVAAMVQKVGAYLLHQQVVAPQDPRRGLIRGGFGTYQTVLRDGKVAEDFIPGPIDWASTEHNIDAYFFFRAAHRLTRDARYASAAASIATALVTGLWNSQTTQFAQGLTANGRDETLALDCAAWGALFLTAIGDHQRASLALQAAGLRYATLSHGHKGHRPYAAGPLVPPTASGAAFHTPDGSTDWSQTQAVWPEGSAGVALSAWRLGDRATASSILAELEPLRTPTGRLPDLTERIPFAFTGEQSVAGTAWVELVRLELAARPEAQTLWVDAATLSTSYP